MTNFSAIDSAGEAIEDEVVPAAVASNLGLLVSVGTNPSFRNLDDKSDSRSSNWNVGDSRYVVDSLNEPSGCGMGGNSCVWVGNGGCVGDGGISIHSANIAINNEQRHVKAHTEKQYIPIHPVHLVPIGQPQLNTQLRGTRPRRPPSQPLVKLPYREDPQQAVQAAEKRYAVFVYSGEGNSTVVRSLSG